MGQTPLLPVLTEARALVEAMASNLAALDLPRKPLRVRPDGVAVWWESDRLVLLGDAEGVFLSWPHGPAVWPDWFAMSRTEARAIASAILAASASVGGES